MSRPKCQLQLRLKWSWAELRSGGSGNCTARPAHATQLSPRSGTGRSPRHCGTGHLPGARCLLLSLPYLGTSGFSFRVHTPQGNVTACQLLVSPEPEAVTQGLLCHNSMFALGFSQCSLCSSVMFTQAVTALPEQTVPRKMSQTGCKPERQLQAWATGRQLEEPSSLLGSQVSSVSAAIIPGLSVHLESLRWEPS